MANSPVNMENMLPWLTIYPDRQMVVLLIEGFLHGFQLPKFTGFGCQLSLAQHSSIVASKLLKEVSEGRMAGPFDCPPFVNMRISPLGIVPKKEPQTCRLIHHCLILMVLF